MLQMSGYHFAGGDMLKLTPLQCELALCTQTITMGGTVPKPYLTEEEFDKKLSKSATVQEFSEAMKQAQALESKQSYEDLRAEMNRKAQEMGITEVY